jgi:hypothetical protein
MDDSGDDSEVTEGMHRAQRCSILSKLVQFTCLNTGGGVDLVI